MKCPNCNEILLMTQRINIEIDYCPSCRGVWLDKGELDKMLQYADQPISYAQNTPPPYQEQRPYNGTRPYQNKPYRKKSFLGDLFDFD